MEFVSELIYLMATADAAPKEDKEESEMHILATISVISKKNNVMAGVEYRMGISLRNSYNAKSGRSK